MDTSARRTRLVQTLKSADDIDCAAWFCVLGVLSNETILTVVFPPPDLPGAPDGTAQLTEAALAK